MDGHVKPSGAGITTGWLCPHCFRREPKERYLGITDEVIPSKQDRKAYWHLLSKGVPEKDHGTLRKLVNRRLQASGVDIPGYSACIHCHMQIPHSKAEGRYIVAESDSVKLLEQLLESLADASRDPDPAAQRWEHLDQYSAAIRGGSVFDGGQAFLALPHAQTKDSPYLLMLWERLLREADGYLLLLELDNQGDETAQMTLRNLARVHSEELPLKNKPAVVVLLYPPQEDDQQEEEHTVVLRLLDRMFPNAPRRVLTPEEPWQEDLLPWATRELALQLGLLQPDPEPEEEKKHFWDPWLEKLFPEKLRKRFSDTWKKLKKWFSKLLNKLLPGKKKEDCVAENPGTGDQATESQEDLNEQNG